MNWKKMLSWLLVCAFLVALAPLSTARAADGVSVWDGSVAEDFAGGKGTKAQPYKIQTAAQLAYLAQSVKSGTNYSSQYISLEADVDLDRIPWTPIGIDSITSFMGTFLGNGHSVDHLYINARSSNNQGLFGYVNNGEIKELRVLNADVTGGINVGGLCGSASNYIYDCSVSGSVKGEENVGGITGSGGSTIRCINYASVLANSQYAGGIKGSNGGTTNLCINYGSVDTYGKGAGGIIGSCYYSAEISNSMNLGRVGGNALEAGGIVGSATYGITVVNCANIGAVASRGVAGGVFGYSNKDSSSSSSKITNCYNAGSVSSTDPRADVGSLLGHGRTTFTNCYVLQSVADALDEQAESGVTFKSSLKSQEFAAELNRNIDTNQYETWFWNADYYQGYPYHEPRTVKSIYVSQKPAKLLYRAGQSFDPTGMVVSALCTDGSSFEISLSELSYSPSGALSTTTKNVNIFYGSLSTSVAVWVSENPSEYEIVSLTLADGSGAALNYIPRGQFWATAAVKRIAEGGDMRVIIASYTADGRMTALSSLRFDMPVNATAYVSVPINNSDGAVSEVRAFVVSDPGMAPVADPVSVR